MHDRAYSLLEIKSFDDDQRIIEGIATTVSTDRTGDVVEAKGARFRRRADGTPDVPIKFQHGKDAFVGDVGVGRMLRADPTAEGIPVRIQIERESEPGRLKDILDFVWSAVRKRLVTGLSIGFKAIDAEPIKGTRGDRFKVWEFLELSLVTIPANADATITSFKSIDADLRAALGQEQGGESRHTPPGASGRPVVKLIQPKSRGDEMNIGEKIKEFEGTRGTKQAQMLALMEKSAVSGETLDQAAQEEFDTLEVEVKALNDHIERLQKVQAMTVASAKPVDGTTTKAAAESRSTIVTVAREEKLEPGIKFARFMMCMAAAQGNTAEALNIMQAQYPTHPGIEVLKSAQQAGRSVEKHIASMAEFRTKTDVAAGTTTGTTWALPLLAYNDFTSDFVEFLRPQTLIGKFGTGNIPSLRRVPFNVHIKGQTSGGTGYWVGQGKGKPVTSFDFNDTYHGFFKVAAISVITEELIRFSDPSAEALVRDGLAGALIQKIDETFIDPTVAAVANVSPASITWGTTGIVSSGDTAAAVRADILDLWDAALDANLPLTSAVYVMTPHIALALSLMVTTDGVKEFPNISMMGGTLEGIPVMVSNYVPAGTVVLVFASEIWLSDDGVVTVTASREASIEMVDNPANNSGTPTMSAGMVSMFQTNSVALRGERYINWSKRRSTAAKYLFAVSWGGAES